MNIKDKDKKSLKRESRENWKLMRKWKRKERNRKIKVKEKMKKKNKEKMKEDREKRKGWKQNREE